MLVQAARAWGYARQNGWRALAGVVMRRLKRATWPFGKIPVTGKYEELIGEPFGITPQHTLPSTRTINWFIPPVGKGSGGHLNLFRFIRLLEGMGFESRIVIVGSPRPISTSKARQEINDWFFPLNADVYIDADDRLPGAHFAFATSWQTAYFVRRFRGCTQKCYFVQDFEPWFYAAGTDSLLAEATYHFGFTGFTAGGWLAQKLSQEYGMQTHALGFSFERELYRPRPELYPHDGKRRVFFYARPPTARRAFELGILVLRELCRRLPDVHVILAGWDLKTYEIPFPHEHAGLVELDQLADLYARSDVALVLSCSNLSLLPLELMACGVPVVSNRAPYTEWLLTKENAMLAEPTIDDLTQTIQQVLDDSHLKRRLSTAGMAFAARTSWEGEADKLARQLNLMRTQS